MSPLLLVATERNQQVVVQACRQSQRCGVRAGMSVAHARALLPGDVVVEPHQPEQDEAALQALARWALRFTPLVQVDPPDGLLLEITGCEHLYGGTRRMLQHVIEQTSRLGLQGRGAIGPTLGCAWALARFGGANAILETREEVPDTLAPLPVRALRLEGEFEQALQAVAVETVGQLMALPRRSLGERFGPALLLRLDEALGEAFEPVEPIRAGEPVRAERAFAGPVKQLEAVMQTARALVAQLCDQLARQEAGARQLRIELERIDTGNLHETLTLSRPSRDGRHLWPLLRPRLEQVHMGYGIERMTLHATSVARLPHQQCSAEGWGGEESPAGSLNREVGALVDQYIARLGPSRVSVVETKQTHVPEQVFSRRPVDEEAQKNARAPGSLPIRGERSASRAQVVDADRPTLLHRHPQAVQVMLLSPEGPVMTVSHGGESVRIVSSVGPERITPRWWLVGGDARKPAPRDYYKVQDEHGRWWWLYRQAGTSNWFVHGRWC